MLKYLVIYRTKKNEIKEHLLEFPITREKGEFTNNGWEVIDIQIFYNSRFISIEEFEKELSKTNEQIEKQKKKNIKKQKFENKIFEMKREAKLWKNKYFKL